MTKITDIIKNVAGVRLNAWNDRVYVNLPADRALRGDTTAKIWIKDNVLTVVDGKGSRSTGWNEAYRAMVDALTAAGAVRDGYSDTISATWTLP